MSVYKTQGGQTPQVSSHSGDYTHTGNIKPGSLRYKDGGAVKQKDTTGHIMDELKFEQVLLYRRLHDPSLTKDYGDSQMAPGGRSQGRLMKTNILQETMKKLDDQFVTAKKSTSWKWRNQAGDCSPCILVSFPFACGCIVLSGDAHRSGEGVRTTSQSTCAITMKMNPQTECQNVTDLW